jgi:hypothetical protein
MLVEAVLTPSTDPTRVLTDMLMMVFGQRPKANRVGVSTLLQEAGFSMVQVIRAAGVSVIESRPV